MRKALAAWHSPFSSSGLRRGECSTEHGAGPTVHTSADYLRLRNTCNMSDEDVREFAHTAATINVCGDLASPKGDARNDKTISKVLYAMPCLAPSATRAVVGGDAFDDLLFALNFDAKLAQKYSVEIRQNERLIGRPGRRRSRARGPALEFFARSP